MTGDRAHPRRGHAVVTGVDAAAAARIGAALLALDAELAAAGIPADSREDVIIMLAARRRQERTRPQQEAHWARIAARQQRPVDVGEITGPGGAR